MSLEVERLTKTFGAFWALDSVELVVREGEFLALLGPSGSGKTTLLRVLAGLEQPDGGRINFKGENLIDKHVRDRGAGFVFQHYALFRHMTVAENIAFGLKVRPPETRPSKAAISNRVEQLLSLVQLEGLGRRFPAQLSGGQRQRVALARALAIEPKLLLLDEPFGALDAKVRKELRRWLRRLHREMGLTSVFVTHDQEEALDLADRVAIMNKGKIEQVGTPEEVYRTPANAFVYDFLGGANKLHCTIEDGVAYFENYSVPRPDLAGVKGRATAYARSDDLALAPADQPGIPAVIGEVFRAGPTPRVELRLNDESFVDAALKEPLLVTLEYGQKVSIQPRAFRVFAET
ncbi:MAG TPA: sulfate/molybdate ABC transporter ATP-binding protein [Caulobacterales bacterium]|nr:sulfate/molybdate ABC transporter ATP-binding protein [Caulobacterales bacterium]